MWYGDVPGKGITTPTQADSTNSTVDYRWWDQYWNPPISSLLNYPQRDCNCCPHCGGRRVFTTTTVYETGDDIDTFTTS